MDLKQATVTIPYLEFEKHQEQVKEIESAREINEKMKNGELYDKKYVFDMAKRLQATTEFLNMHMMNRHTNQAMVDIHTFAQDKGIEIEKDRNFQYSFVNKK